jgi:hypothetical protein
MLTRSQTNLFSILILIVGFISGYLYYTQFSSEPVVIESDVIVRDDLDDYENMNVNFSVLDKEAFSSLIQLGESPVEPGEAGKKDIFAPLP